MEVSDEVHFTKSRITKSNQKKIKHYMYWCTKEWKFQMKYMYILPRTEL